jgi:hypothetical protein
VNQTDGAGRRYKTLHRESISHSKKGATMFSLLPILAQNHSDNAAAAGIFVGLMGFVCCVFVVAMAIQVWLCYFVSNLFKAIPPEHRKQEPGMVWLMLSPLFNLVWIFFVFPRLSQSFKSYFDAQGVTTYGDCQGQLALIYCILVCCSVIPYLGALAGLAALVILIIMLVKFNEMKKQIAPRV